MAAGNPEVEHDPRSKTQEDGCLTSDLSNPPTSETLNGQVAMETDHCPEDVEMSEDPVQEAKCVNMISKGGDREPRMGASSPKSDEEAENGEAGTPGRWVGSNAFREEEDPKSPHGSRSLIRPSTDNVDQLRVDEQQNSEGNTGAKLSEMKEKGAEFEKHLEQMTNEKDVGRVNLQEQDTSLRQRNLEELQHQIKERRLQQKAEKKEKVREMEQEIVGLRKVVHERESQFRVLLQNREEERAGMLEHLRSWEKERGEMRKEIESLRQRNRRLETDRSALVENIEVLQQENQRRQQQIHEWELQNAQQVASQTGSYDDREATPPLLDIAVEAVWAAVGFCASDLFNEMKSQKIAVNTADPCFESLGTQPFEVKIALQYTLGSTLFAFFENEFFGLGTPAGAVFAPPKAQREERFRLFQRIRYEGPVQLYNEMPQFQSFVQQKWVALFTPHNTMFSNLPPSGIEYFFASLKKGTPFLSSFVKLAKAVWVLHQLTFAFDPAASMFRVPKGSTFDEEYMKTLRPMDDLEVDPEGQRPLKVAFTVIPGFRVRMTVVKALIHLQPQPQPQPQPQSHGQRLMNFFFQK